MQFETSNQAFIIAAYAITWAVILGYLAHLARRAGRVKAEHDRVVTRGEVR